MFLSHREVSAQEVVYHLLAIPLKKSSRQTIFINTGMPETQVDILKPKRGLKDLPDKDISRPDILQDQSVEDTYLADFAANYKMDYKKNLKQKAVDD